MKSCSKRDIALIMIIISQIILYVTFLALDLTGNSVLISRNIKYTIIVLCFCYALFSGKESNKGIVICIRTGLLFTVISDLFLLMLDYYTYGVLTFIVVQQIYGIRMILANLAMRNNENNCAESSQFMRIFLRKVILRISMEMLIAITVCLLLWRSGVHLQFLLVISAFYFTCIVTNTITSIQSAIHKPKVKSNVLFAIGMGLFLLCDINVGLFNLSEFVSMPTNIYNVLYTMSSVLMWAFYAPSQILIALSSDFKLTKFTNNR